MFLEAITTTCFRAVTNKNDMADARDCKVGATSKFLLQIVQKCSPFKGQSERTVVSYTLDSVMSKASHIRVTTDHQSDVLMSTRCWDC
jgi:hypothetical protein